MKQKINDKLNSQKGITSADVVIALAIILTTVSVIAMIYTNLIIGSKEVDRKTGATRIATNLIENISQLYFDEIDDTLNDLVSNGSATKHDNMYFIENVDQVLNTSIPEGYHVNIKIENVGSYDLAKKVIISVEYKSSNIDKKVAIDKIFKKESIRESNSPKFTKEYIEKMIGVGTAYQMYDENSKDSAGDKIICPIKYDVVDNKYKIITNVGELWYSYSNKIWARVLVLDPTDLIEIEQNGITNDMLKGNKSFVWIPRYGTTGGDPYGSIRFKYKATDYAILNNDGINYIDTTETLNNALLADFDQNEVGRWCHYSELFNVSTIARVLNQSQYGPMIEY